MDERSDQIVDHIHDQRNQLGRNLDELENRVSSSMDWRMQFDRHPAAMMGAALGGGLLLGALLRGASSPSRYRSSSAQAYSSSALSYPGASSMKRISPGTGMQRQRASETFENIKGALIGYGIAQLKSFLLGALPGFERHFNETEQHNSPMRHSGQQWQEGSAPYGTSPGYSSSGSYGSPSSSGAGHQGSAASHTTDKTHRQPGGPTGL